MADVIATVWDFDKTLIKGYMQEPLFEARGVDGKAFWDENNLEIKKNLDKKLEVNKETFYLNLMLRYAKKGKPFYGLNNKELRSYGTQQTFYPGAVDLFKRVGALNDYPVYKKYDVKFENYIVSTGLKKIIEGSSIAEYTTKIWGAEFIEDENEDGNIQISEVAYSLDNTTKTRAIFEINKGIGIIDGNIDVNTPIPHEDRRVRFCNMIYVADGPSDVPAFSVIKQNHGATLAVYPRGNGDALDTIDALRSAGRVDMLAETDYTEESTASLWLMNRLKKQANAIVQAKKDSINKLGPGTPMHQI